MKTMRAMAGVVCGSAVLGAAALLGGFGPEAEMPVAPALTETAPGLATYTVDPVHSSVVFGIKHSGVANFYGVFKDVSGTFTFDPSANTGGDFNFVVQTASVDTRNSNRDDHLRNADFFNSRQFPEITFESTGIEHVEGDMYKLTGDLTLMGETRPVTADLEWTGTGVNPRGTEVAGFEATFSIKRGDFGMTKYLAPDGSDSGGLGNTVKLIVAIEAAKQ